MPNRSSDFILPCYLVFITLVLSFGVMSSTGFFQRPEQAKRVLEDQGYTKVEITGEKSWFPCSQGDMFITKFRANSVTGKEVKGVVCSGLFKGSTTRIF